MKNAIRYLSFVVLLPSCETTVEVDIPQYPTQLTANMFFTPDSAWRVELSENRYILDTTRFTPVSDASIRVLEQGQAVASLDYQGEGSFGNSIYISQGRRSEIGKTYTVEVTHPTLGNLTASSEVPIPQQILKATLDTSQVQPVPSFSDVPYNYAITVRFDDPPGENFYSISLLERFVGYFSDDIDNDGDYEVWLQEAAYWLTIQSDNPVVNNPFERSRVELFFKDASFNGEQYEITAYLGSNINRNFYLRGSVLEEDGLDRDGNVIRFAGDTVSKITYYVVLRTLTEEYYQYSVTQDLQAFVENNPFAQPVQVFDNVEGGLGIFAGYSQVEQAVTIK